MPAPNGTPLDTCAIYLNGSIAPPELQRSIEEVTVEDSLRLPDVITIRLIDPQIHWVDDSSLALGVEVEVRMGQGNDRKRVGIGEIVAMEFEHEHDHPRLVVQAFDRAHRLHRGTKVRTFQQMSDADVVQKIARDAGFDADVASAGVQHEYLMQDNLTDYAFLSERALRTGSELVVDGRTLRFRPANGSAGQSITLEWGSTLRAFHARMTAAEQLGEVEVRGWDPHDKRAIVGSKSSTDAAPRIGVTPDDARNSAFGSARALVVHRPIATASEAEALAQAALDDATGSFVRVEGTALGNPDLRAGSTVEVKGVGRRLSGTYHVTTTTHVVGSAHGYETHFSVRGRHAETVSELSGSGATAGLAGATALGPVIGLVTNVKDPDKKGKVKVKFPWLSDDQESAWARVVAPMAGPDRGLELLPEVDDEVLVVFEHGDVHRPLVVGGLWNGHDAPPLADAVSGDGAVQQRGIVTRAGHKIVLDDKDGGGGITVEDSAGNTVTLDAGGSTVKVKSAGDLTVEATGSLTLKGQSVDVTANGGNVTVSGTQVNLN